MSETVTYDKIESKICSGKLTDKEKEVLKALCRGLRLEEAVKALEIDKNGIDRIGQHEIREVVSDVFGSDVRPHDIRKAVLAELADQGIQKSLLNRIAGRKIS